MGLLAAATSHETGQPGLIHNKREDANEMAIHVITHSDDDVTVRMSKTDLLILGLILHDAAIDSRYGRVGSDGVSVLFEAATPEWAETVQRRGDELMALFDSV